MSWGSIWVLVLFCQCAQPSQTLFASRDKCVEQGKRELDTLNYWAIRCVEVPR